MNALEGLSRAFSSGVSSYLGVTGAVERQKDMKARRELVEGEVRKMKEEEANAALLKDAYQEDGPPAFLAAQNGVTPTPMPAVPTDAGAAAQAMPVAAPPPAEVSPLPQVPGSQMAAQGVAPAAGMAPNAQATSNLVPFATPQQSAAAAPAAAAPAQQSPLYSPMKYDRARERLVAKGGAHLVDRITKDEMAAMRSDVERMELVHKKDLLPLLQKAEKLETEAKLRELPDAERRRLMLAKMADADMQEKMIAYGFRGAQLGQGESVAKMFSESGIVEPGVNASNIVFAKGKMTDKGFEKGDGEEYMIAVDKSGNVVKNKDGAPIAVPVTQAQAAYQRAFGGDIKTVTTPQGATTTVLDSRGNTIRTIEGNAKADKNSLTPEDYDRRAKDALQRIKDGLGLMLDSTGKLIANVGIGEMQKSVDLGAKAGILVRAGKTPEEAAKIVMDEYRREQELAKTGKGKGEASVPTPWKK